MGVPMVESIKNKIIERFRRNYKTLSKLINDKLKKKGKRKSLCK
jgi:hypothetical protein